MNRYAQRVAELTNPDGVAIDQRKLKPLSDTELESIEDEIGHPFPSGFREFLRDYGGIFLGHNQCRRAALYHLGDHHFGRTGMEYCISGLGVLLEWKAVQADPLKELPPELILIGGYGGGNIGLFLAITGDCAGSIYQGRRPLTYEEFPSYYPELELVARSFDDFIHMLKPLQERYYEKKEYYEQEQQEITSDVEKLLSLEPRAGNKYSQIMADLKGRFVYATLGENAKILSETDLQEIEQQIGYSLPSDYRDFLRSFGGYSFIPSPSHDGVYDCSVSYPCKFPTPPMKTSYLANFWGSYKEINFFHGNIGPDYHDLMEHYYRLKDYLPLGLLPIADGGRVCLKLADVDAGAVYRVDGNVADYSPSECYGGDSSPDNITLLATSFDEFMSSLRTGVNGEFISS